ncbi:hypothetical protein NEFER03_1820 [Nematocida sp. LUAm3]|nr:hypothetical protein NEFER03_1820 [Nematocida sp. LUAm3]KAI5173873.1 hypothetical protein NEFER02_0340 [Nematocida sp. LUAm2]KAI5177382.1 hypothetical protein NEFER01_0657 [Nematocida sp. LUAm1]
MKKSSAEGLYKEALMTKIWLGCTFGYILLYIMSAVKILLGVGAPKRLLHVLSCFCLIVVYGTCLFFRSSNINLQKLLKDGNFRCLLVACSFLSMKGALVPMLPFMIMSAISISEYVVKNRKMFLNTSLLDTSMAVASRRDEITLFALKIEILSVPLLLLHLLTGGTDLFSVVSYSSMVWFEYTTNPCMKKAVNEISAVVEGIVYSPNMPQELKKRYGQIKAYLSKNVPSPVSPEESKKTA